MPKQQTRQTISQKPKRERKSIASPMYSDLNFGLAQTAAGKMLFCVSRRINSCCLLCHAE
ncbi:hypothetical protein BDW66DRAFT_145691 [Aspergillus desertorum]